MGKSKHSKTPMWMTASEWKTLGGHKDKKETRFKRALPFDHCALSLTPFGDDSTVCTSDGFVFDLVNIVPYVKEHKKNPVTGAAMNLKDLISIHFHKNPSGQYHDPFTFKVFTDQTH